MIGSWQTSVPPEDRKGAVPRAAAIAAIVAISIASSARAQELEKAKGSTEEPDVVVNGQRGSAVADIAPIATFDAKMIEGTGATSLGELLRVLTPMARSADGSDPILLLNGQRISGWEEIGGLPPEAIAKTEVLPEEAAIRYGYPPTRRLLNFVTKARFRSIELAANAGQSTAGGAGNYGANSGLTRIASRRRLTLTGEYHHANPLWTSRRPFALDPDNLFDPTGNVIAADGGELDPALSRAAGHTVLVAGVPVDPQSRGQLSSYGNPNIFDVRPFNTLIDRSDSIKGNAVLAMPVTDTVDASFTFSAEQGWTQSIEGHAPLTIFVPASSPFSPFDRDVLLYRFVLAGGLRPQRSETTTLHAGAVVRGGVSGWQWDVTAAMDDKRRTTYGDTGYGAGPINQAVAAGADPFGTLAPAMLGPRLSQRSMTLTRNAEVKAVARGSLLRLPAGNLSLIATTEGAWGDAHTRSQGVIDNDFRIDRARVEGGLTIDLPLTSRREKVLPYVGDLSVSFTKRLRHVQDYGELTDTTFGLAWGPFKRLQFTATLNRTATAPDIEMRSAATVENLNVPFFDFGTGRSVYVTLITGGNPGLAAERKRVRTYGFTWQPFEKTQLQLSGSYSETLIHDPSGVVSALTPAVEAQLPEQFVRDSFGRLTTVILKPFNFYRQRQRTINAQINFSKQFGKPASPDKLQQQTFLYIGASPYLNLRDQLELKPGLPAFDLIHGETVDGSFWHFKTAVYGWGGLSRGGNGLSFNWQYFGPSHIHGGTPETELRFSHWLKIDFSAFVALHHFLPHQDWARKTKLTLQVINPLDQHQTVRDSTGATPFRYQPAFSDPAGRTFKLTLRKLF